jgi:GH24 family phage-related lysozyme (muramidase)
MATKKSRLAEIYKSEKARGGGIASTLGKRALEKIDPRQIFNQTGFLATVLPSLFKAYSATETGTAAKISLSPSKESMVTEAMNVRMNDLASRMNDVAVNTQLSAKNSLVLPAMARDMNLMRQNIAKLAKAQGVKPTYKADMFFKGASEREKEYESKFGKAKATMPTASPTTKPEEKGGLSGILGFLAPLFAPLLKIGSTIVGAITSTLSGLGEFLLKGITSIFSVDNLMKALGLTGSVLKGLIKMVGMIVTNPIFLAIAAAGSLFALAKMLREEFDEKKQRYMELATKKKEQGALSPEEEAELQKLNSTKLQQAAREELGGYDPILNKVTKTTRVQGIVSETAAAGSVLRDEAAIQLRDEYEQAGKNPNLITNEEIAQRAEQLKQLRTAVPDDGSFAAAEARRFRQTEGSEGRMARLGVSPSPVEGGRGTINPPNVSPTPAPAVENEGVSENLVNYMKQKENAALFKNKGESKAFWDYKQWSIGYGTKASGPDEVITEEEADKRLREELQKSQNAVISHAKKHNYNFNQNQIDALTSFAYNLGPGILKQLTADGTRSVEEIAQKIPEYNKAGGKVNVGLQQRRAADFAMFTSEPAPTMMAAAKPSTPTITPSIPASVTPPTMTVASAKPPTGQIVTAATTEVEKERIQLASAPIVVSAPSVNVQQSQPNRMPQSINQPSVVDSEFMKLLVGRTVTI